MESRPATAHDTEAAPGPTVVPRARLRPPQVRGLRRDRLLASLAGAADHRVVLITGPAGWGKTTLLAQLVESSPNTAWYHLDPADGRVATLMGHLGGALAPCVPALGGAGERWRSADEAAADLDALGPDGVPERTVLALDDLHLVAGTPAESALGRLVELAPPWLVLAASCRQPPAWNLSRLRVSGALYEVGPDDLRFRSWEVERLFADVYGEPLPPADLARLARGLEGWAAGLQLFHLATRGKHASERRRAVAALPARSKLIRDYLSGNVLDEMPDDQRAFVVDTSVLGRLTPTLCDRLRDRSDSRRLLGDLEAHQVFVTRLDEDDLAFRYHEVFRAYLETRLVERDGEAQAKEWARLGASLLEDESGCLSDALRAYCWAGDWASVGRILETGGAELADDSGSWLDWLPTGLIEDDPWVMIATARRAAATGRLVTALDRYERVEHLHAGTAPRDISRRERAAIRAWLDPAAPAPAGWPGRLRTILRSHPVAAPPAGMFGGTVVGVTVTGGEGTPPSPVAGEPAVPAAPAPVPPADGAGDAFVDAVAAVLAGQLALATPRLEALTDDPDVPPPLAVGARLGLAVAAAFGGRPVEGELGDLAELVELVDLPWLASLALAAGGLAGGPAVARAVAVAGECEAQGDPWGAVAARAFAALGDLLAGGAPVAELDELAARARRLEARVIESWATAWLASALARSGDERAPEVARAAEALAGQAGVPGAEVWAIEVQAQLDAGAGAELVARSAAIRRLRGVDVAVPGAPAAPARAPAEVEAEPAPARAAAIGLRVRCLGGFRLELDGSPVDVGAVKPRARAALHLLAAHGGRPVHTETLVDALWPDLDAASGKRNLQVAVSSLRRLLDDHRPGASALIRRAAATYALALPDVGCSDVAVFAAACGEARDASRAGESERVLDAGDRALVAYGGDLLPEEGPAD
ncbi:MAG TPA: winged helix-turn-helix domain-containing protein, partial [Acidimicrobiales bacterium]|nr:winged helix-turn-helix domain-containing protein [Acidimicrobiales bacterium]